MGFFRRLFRKRRIRFTEIHVATLLRAVMSTADRELACDECSEELERFAEMIVSGVDAEKAIPLVKAHLDRCKDCREEFEALVEALSADEVRR